MMTLLFFSLGLLLPLGLLIKFALADADFTLSSKKHVNHEAIEGKVVWITGASRGIGEVLAKQFASLGAKLIISSRNEAELHRVKSELKGKYAPEDVKILPLDLATGEESLKHVVEQAVTLFPGAGVDYLVHNAAYERPKSKSLDASEETLKTTFEVNVFGTISLTKLVASHMVKQGGGHFVVMSSAAGKVPAPGQAIYSASKHALNGYFNSLRSELSQKGIKVTVVCPGPIETLNGTVPSTSKDNKKLVSSERCAELTIIAASHNLKEAWISYQPILLVMYLMQYIPSLGFWIMDKVGGNRVEAFEKKGNAFSWNLLFAEKKTKTN